ncbi:unnamed protein product [Lampetra fluviatilis]
MRLEPWLLIVTFPSVIRTRPGERCSGKRASWGARSIIISSSSGISISGGHWPLSGQRAGRQQGLWEGRHSRAWEGKSAVWTAAPDFSQGAHA